MVDIRRKLTGRVEFPFLPQAKMLDKMISITSISDTSEYFPVICLQFKQ